VHGYPDGVCNCFYRRKPGFNRFIRGKHVFWGPLPFLTAPASKQFSWKLPPK
jgi:hypothetical protein